MYSLLFLSFVYYKIDRRIWENKITPYFLFSTPITLLVVLNNLFFCKIGFYEIDYNLITPLLIGFTAIFIGSIFVNFFSGLYGTMYSEMKITSSSFHDDTEYLHKILRITVPYLFLFSCFYLFRVGANSSLMRDILSSGITDHIMSFNLLALPIIFTKQYKSSFKKIIYILVVIFPPILYGTRGWVLLSFSSAIFFNSILKNKHLNARQIIFFIITGITFFLLSYLWRGSLEFTYESFEKTLIHVIGYLLAGIQGGNQLLASSCNPEPYKLMIYNGFYNLAQLITGGGVYASNVAPNFFISNSIFGTHTNVSTAFGTAFFGFGYIGGFLLFTVLSIFLYNFFLLSNLIKSKQLLLLNSFYLGASFLSFFEFYFGLLFFIETTVLIAILYIFTNIFRSYTSRKNNSIKYPPALPVVLD